jgi:hypothetical protein
MVLDGDTPGYLFVPQGDGPFPTILYIGGYDGKAEENFASARAALDRGWAFVSLDGPGTASRRTSDASPCAPTGSTSCPGW